MTTISLAVIVKNEQRHIAACLESVKPIVDEMVVVDTGSTDRTKEIAASMGAIVSDFPWSDDFAAARNAAIERTKGDWILVLDADERLIADYGAVLRDFISGGQRIGRITIKSRFVQNGEEQIVQSAISRIFPRHVRFQGAIHEQLISELPRIDSGIVAFHEGYYETDKSERNLRILEKELQRRPDDAYLLFHIGKQYRGSGELSKAEQYFERAYGLLSRVASQSGHSHGSSVATYASDAVIDYLYVLLETKNFEQALNVIGNEQAQLQELADFHFVCGLIYMELAICFPQDSGELLPLIEHSYLQALAAGEAGRGREIVQGTGSYLAAYNLGVYYELLGNREAARSYYQMAVSAQYEPALKRLEVLK
ncbi:glycosyltransferase [Paenibacillus chartarius]|uniref:Glycosyltransferase n=1 Tax=Paenibacillus chartarius TaxID=747481 RepID=A0ABV6DEL2_9BACL